MKLPKLHLACTNSPKRPVMNHVYIDETRVTASDAHILVSHDRKIIDECVKGLPEKCYIHRTQFIPLTKEFITAIYRPESKLIEITYKNDTISFIKVMFEIGNYPNYKAIIPNGSHATDCPHIGVNPNYLKTLCDAMSTDYTACKLTFNGLDKAIRVTMPINEPFEGDAIIMPNTFED